VNLGWLRALVVVSAILGMAGCSAGLSDDPVSRRLAWFGYVAGDTFRSGCAGSATERYRVVFNAEYTVQVRAYDIVATGDGADLHALVFRGGILSDRAFASVVEGLVGREAETRLGPRVFADFKRSLSESKAFHGDTPVYLRSDSFYWVVLSCVEGRFMARAFTGPRPVLDALPFRGILLDNDPTGVPVRVQRPVEADRITGYGRAYSPMQSEDVDRARGAASGFLFQFRYENGRILRVGA